LSEPDEEREDIEGEEPREDKSQEKDTSVLFNVKMRKPFLQRMKEAAKKSEGRYPTTSALARSAIEEKVKWIEQGMPEPESDEDWTDEEPTKRGKAHEHDVKRLHEIAEEELGESFSTFDFFRDTDDFFEVAKKAKLKGKTAVFSDSRSQKFIRLKLRDFVCPKGFWDSKRKWNPKEGTKLIETFRKQLQIPRSVAAGLVKDPECEADCKSCPHSEEESEEEDEEE